MSHLPDYYAYLINGRSLTQNQAVERLSLVQNAFVSDKQRRWFFAGGPGKMGGKKTSKIAGGKYDKLVSGPASKLLIDKAIKDKALDPRTVPGVKRLAAAIAKVDDAPLTYTDNLLKTKKVTDNPRPTAEAINLLASSGIENIRKIMKPGPSNERIRDVNWPLQARIATVLSEAAHDKTGAQGLSRIAKALNDGTKSLKQEDFESSKKNIDMHLETWKDFGPLTLLDLLG